MARYDADAAARYIWTRLPRSVGEEGIAAALRAAHKAGAEEMRERAVGVAAEFGRTRNGLAQCGHGRVYGAEIIEGRISELPTEPEEEASDGEV